MLEIQNWGLIDYEEALKKQEELVDQIAESNSDGVIVFCSHPPIVTLGRKTQKGDVYDWDGKTMEISRGGRATYHGPSQLVVYPIINMNKSSVENPRPLRDVHWHLRTIENAIVETLENFKIKSTGKTSEQKQVNLENTGVWIENQKVASLGIAVRKWISYHGAAINFEEDPKAFWGMNPCGYDREVMTSVEAVKGFKLDKLEFQKVLQEKLLKKF